MLVATSDPRRAEGLAEELGAERSLELVGRARDLADAVEAASEGGVDVVVADDDLRRPPGARLTLVLRKSHEAVRVVLVVDRAGPRAILDHLALGAHGLVERRSAADLLRLAVRSVWDGGIFIDPAIAPVVVKHAARVGPPAPRGGAFEPLTTRQTQVLELVPLGLSNGQIARVLGIGEETVKTHLRMAMRKLGVATRTEAAAEALRQGLTP